MNNQDKWERLKDWLNKWYEKTQIREERPVLDTLDEVLEYMMILEEE